MVAAKDQIKKLFSRRKVVDEPQNIATERAAYIQIGESAADPVNLRKKAPLLVGKNLKILETYPLTVPCLCSYC